MTPVTTRVIWEAEGARPLVAVRTSAVPAPWSDESELSTRFPGPIDLAPASRRARTVPVHSPPSGNRCTH